MGNVRLIRGISAGKRIRIRKVEVKTEFTSNLDRDYTHELAPGRRQAIEIGQPRARQRQPIWNIVTKAQPPPSTNLRTLVRLLYARKWISGQALAAYIKFFANGLPSSPLVILASEGK
jgi:hypothetical protein